MVVMTLVSIPLMDRTGRRTLHLYGLGGMFIFSIFITISFLIKVSDFQLKPPILALYMLCFRFTSLPFFLFFKNDLFVALLFGCWRLNI